MRSTAALAILCIGASVALIGSAPDQRNCAPTLSNEKKIEIINYVRKKYKLPESVSLTVAKEQPMNDTCYRELTFEGKSRLNTWQVKMFLSPDERFLTDQLFDIKADPYEEERRRDEAIMAGLTPNKGANDGPDDAPVTIVIFSDFECPFCRDLAATLRQVKQAEEGKLRVVFHHLPLSNHAWARTAAEGAACAQLQGRTAFWAMHDALFSEQDEITPENVRSKLLELASRVRPLDLASFHSCLENEMSLGLVLRDINLASANSVNGTPTLFVNGRRLTGVYNKAELVRAIDEAAKDTPQSQPLHAAR